MPILVPVGDDQPPPGDGNLIVEDGTGKPDAESYCSAAFADDYHIARGNATWDVLPTSQKEQLLRKATDYMLQAYRVRWRGYRAVSGQALDWPRNAVPTVDGYGSYYGYGAGYYSASVVPLEVKRACAELALRALSGALLGDTGGTTGASGAIKREKLGPIEVEYETSGSVASTAKKFPAVDTMLNAFFQSFQLVRA